MGEQDLKSSKYEPTSHDHAADLHNTTEYLTVNLADQVFGIPVLQIQDVITLQNITPVPLAPKEVAGSLNLRGRIVTAIDVRKRLGLNIKDTGKIMSVVVEHGQELYSLIVDGVGDVIGFPDDEFEKNPPTLEPLWREISQGIFRHERRLILILDVANLFDSITVET